jgi:hypothetical protein
MNFQNPAFDGQRGPTVAAIPIDAAVLAWEDVQSDEPTVGKHDPLGAIRILPMVHPEEGSTGLVLSGNF